MPKEGQKLNLEQNEIDERLNNSDHEVDADCSNDNSMNESPQHLSDNNTIHSQVTHYFRASSSKFNRQQQSSLMTKVLKNYFEGSRLQNYAKREIICKHF